MDGYEENERSWRSDCETRIDCLAGEREARNCAWDEKMYDAVHTAVRTPALSRCLFLSLFEYSAAPLLFRFPLHFPLAVWCSS